MWVLLPEIPCLALTGCQGWGVRPPPAAACRAVCSVPMERGLASSQCQGTSCVWKKPPTAVPRFHQCVLCRNSHKIFPSDTFLVHMTLSSFPQREHYCFFSPIEVSVTRSCRKCLKGFVIGRNEPSFVHTFLSVSLLFLFELLIANVCRW